MKKSKFIVRSAIQLLSIAVITAADILLKNLALEKLEGKGLVTVIPHFIGLYYCENTGAAFSLFSSSTDVLSYVTAVALIAATVWMLFPKKRPVAYDVIVPAIIAGGLGNLIDRFSRGYVIDYIATLFIDFPVFNFADCFITCGCIGLLIYVIYECVRDAKNIKRKDGATDD